MSTGEGLQKWCVFFLVEGQTLNKVGEHQMHNVIDVPEVPWILTYIMRLHPWLTGRPEGFGKSLNAVW